MLKEILYVVLFTALVPLSVFGQNEINIERSFPQEVLAPYDFNAPTGPVFTAQETEKQYTRGDQLEEMIYAAFASGEDKLVIPPGHYRLRENGTIPLKKGRHGNYGSAATHGALIRLQGLRRPDANPFRIIGLGVTIWFTPTDIPRNHVNWGIHMDNCENIILEGFTFDAARPTTFGGKITKIDSSQSRVELQLSQASKTNLDQLNDHGHRPWAVRIFPFSTQGRYMTATYNMHGGWGPALSAITKVTPSDRPDHVWAYFAKSLNLGNSVMPIEKSMLEIMQSEAWQNTYGPDNTLTPGCFIMGQWGVSIILNVDNSRHISLVNINNYHPASYFQFSGGYGGHRLINCTGIPRPGTCRLFGGYASGRFQDLEKGPLIDHLVQLHTEDDAYHICGHYYPLEKLNGKTIKLPHNGANLRSGLVVDIYSKSRNSALYRNLKVTKVISTTYQGDGETVIEVDREINVPAESWATFPEWNNDGWIIRNSYFIHCYQRLLNQGGRNAIFENNYVENVGQGCHFPSSYDGSEGGRIDGVSVRGNIFVDTAISPAGSAINVVSDPRFLEMSRNVNVQDNIIIGPGLLGIHYRRAIGGKISGNLIVSPLALTAGVKPEFKRPDKAMAIQQSSNISAWNNILIEHGEFTKPDSLTGDRFADISDKENKNVISKDNRYIRDQNGQLIEKIRKIITRHGPCKQTRKEIFELVNDFLVKNEDR